MCYSFSITSLVSTAWWNEEQLIHITFTINPDNISSILEISILNVQKDIHYSSKLEEGMSQREINK